MLFKPFLKLATIPGKKSTEIFVGIESNATIIHGTKNIKAKTNGNKTVQHTVISWSYLILGNEARTHIKPNIIIQVLTPNVIPDRSPDNNPLSIGPIKELKGSKYPPKNKILVNADIRTILAYSARKKKTKTAEACSVMKPLTNSDSIFVYNIYSS